MVGVGVGGQPLVSAEENGRRTSRRSASHTTPLTVLAELGVVGFALYAWLVGAASWALVLVTRHRRLLGFGLAAVLSVLFVHSLLYAGFFEDPLTWGVLAVAAAVLSSVPAPASAPEAPPRLAH